jgi:flagellar FliL protein
MPAKPAPIDITTAEATPPKKGGKLLTLLALLFVAVLFGAGGFGAAWFLYRDAASPMVQALRMLDAAGNPAAQPERGGMPALSRNTPADGAFATTYFTFDPPLTTNPQASRRFIQLGVTLSTQYDAKVMDFVKTHEAALRSDMLAVIGSFTEDAMSGRDGREALAHALRDAINERLEMLEGFGGVEGVFFPSFVLQ